MLFQCLCGFKLVFYSTHSDDEPKYLEHITDVKPITARQCIKLLPIVAKYKPDLKNDILSVLHKADISIYDDSMQPLVYKDIQKSLKEIQKL